MLETIIDVVKDSVIDTLKLLPPLYIVFVLMEYFEHKAGDKLKDTLEKSGKSSILGIIGGTLLGLLPQCGFSAAAANLYAGEMITMGTLLAVFISTSDEALPILISTPGSASLIWKLLIAKVIIAFAAGLILDIVLKIIKPKRREKPFEEFCQTCGCENHGIWYSGLKHTLSTALFILIVNLVLGAVIAFIGENRLSEILGGLGIFEPIVSGLVGMIPNCAASVVITELYISNALSFGGAVAGLCTGAGVGLVVLYKANKSVKENICITVVLYAVGVICGILINLFS